MYGSNWYSWLSDKYRCNRYNRVYWTNWLNRIYRPDRYSRLGNKYGCNW